MIYVLHHFTKGHVQMHFVDTATDIDKMNDLQVQHMCLELGIDYAPARKDEQMTVVCARPERILRWEPEC